MIDRVSPFGRMPWPLLFGISAGSLILSSLLSAETTLPGLCGSGAAALRLGLSPVGLRTLLVVNSPALLFTSWALMLAAMMPPLLAMPLAHVWMSSLPRRRGRAATSFIAGYVAAWMVAGPVLAGLALLLRLSAGAGAFVAAAGMAILWSATPWQRMALNRGHRFRRIGIFGLAAVRDCAAFGFAHAGWCIGSCWAWMLVPLVAGEWHLASMVAAGIVMLHERLTPPQRPYWRLPIVSAGLARARIRKWQRVENHG